MDFVNLNMYPVDEHIDDLRKLCRQFHVSDLFVFGSVAKETSTDTSDIDLLVQFSGVNPVDYFDNYIDFRDELERLFSRRVDLVEMQTIKNPILKKSIDRDKIRLYGRENSKVVV